MTLGERLAAATAELRRAGVPSPATDARRLICHVLGISSEALAAEVGAPFPAALEARFAELLSRRAARCPLSQIVGTRAFWRDDFEVTAAVLDPRPETECLVEAALEAPFARVLDLGTGTGCILLSLLRERADAEGVGSDLSAAALEVAARNATRLGLAGRTRLVRADWFEGLEGPFDLIVSNPPYLAEDEFAGLAPEPRLWEPRAALVAGPEGTEAYRAIAGHAGQLLAAGGRLILEIGPTQAEAVSALLRTAGFSVDPPRKDLDGRDRVLVARPVRK